MTAVPLLGGPIEDLKPGEWYEVPNSHLRDVLPNPIPPGNGPESIIAAWNSGAYDAKRDKLVVFGGGHNDYGGNEIYVFDINSLRWSRIWGPSPNIPATQGPCNETYSDGNPASRHTYDGLEYLPNVDKFLAHGGSLYCGSGSASSGTWLFDFNTLKWTRKTNIPTCAQLEMVSAYDPVTGHVFVNGPASCNELLEYDPIANTWTERGESAGYRKVAAIDSKRRKMVVIGEGTADAYPLKKTGIIPRQRLNTKGANEILNANYPGFEYDPVSDKFVAWNGGAHVYTLNMDTLVWTKVTPVSTNKVIPTPPTESGTYGRFRYIPSKNAFIVVNHIDENVYIYKLSIGGRDRLPTLPPSPPTGAVVQ